MSIYVLDANMPPSPTGVVGELYLGGTNLARGYSYRRRPDGGAVRADPSAPAGEPNVSHR